MPSVKLILAVGNETNDSVESSHLGNNG